ASAPASSWPTRSPRSAARRKPFGKPCGPAHCGGPRAEGAWRHPRTTETPMTGPLYHLGRFCTRHPWPRIACCFARGVALGGLSRSVGDKTSANLTPPGTGSTRATDVLQQRLPDQANGSNPLVLKVGSGTLTDSKNKKAVDDTVDNLKKTPHVVG